jgi:hypothetical protein
MKKLYRVFIGLPTVPCLLTNNNHKSPALIINAFPTHATQVLLFAFQVLLKHARAHAHAQLLFSFQVGPSGFSRDSYW